MVIDQDAENLDMFNVIKRISRSEIRGIAICVMPENVRNSFMIARSLKEINSDIKILAYGHLTFIHRYLFLKSDFDAIHIAGDPERTIGNFF